ncbi:MAG: rhodanese-like domain-containing protein [Methanoculleus sp.]
MVDTFRIPPLLLAVLGITLACACLGSDPDREKPGSKVIHPAEAAIMIEDMENDLGFVIIDLRTADEFAGGHIPGAINIDAATFPEQIERLDPDGTYLIYCRRGMRSAGVHKLMDKAGFREVYEIEGGISAWQAAGMPLAEG